MKHLCVYIQLKLKNKSTLYYNMPFNNGPLQPVSSTETPSTSCPPSVVNLSPGKYDHYKFDSW